MLALIDGDLITHPVAAACEGIHYGVDVGEGNFEYFKYKKEAKAYCLIHELPESSIQQFKDPDPIENCLHSVKLLTESIIRDSGATTYKIFLSGKNNFRLDICPDYKAHRPTEKPVHLAACREYLINKFGAKVVDYMEADDMLGIQQQSDTTIICSLDKDLDTVPGWHYNWNKNKKYWVDEDQADKFFWIQMLTGDSADNIFGIKGVGPKKAEKLLDTTTKENYACVVGLQYAIQFDDPEEMFEKNFSLLRILTEWPDA